MDLPVNYNKISPKERKRVRLSYIEQQKGKCCHCGKPLNENPPSNILKTPITKSLFPVNFFKFPVHLHHNHETGITIGAIHCYCNAILWEYFGE